MDTREAESPTAQKQTPPAGNGTGAPAAPAATERNGPRKRVVFGVIGTIVAIVLIIFGLKWYLYARVHESTDDARVDADPVAITSKINERIDQINVNTDDPVHRGQLLVVMDDGVERAQVRTAQAQYDLAMANQRANTTQGEGGVAQAQGDIQNAQAQVPQAEAGVDQAAAQVQAAQAQVPAAQSAYEKAEADFARTQSLVSTGDESVQQLDAARANASAAAAQLRNANDQVSVASANLQSAQQRVGAAGGGLLSAQGAATTAQGKLAQASDPSQVAAAKAQLAIAQQNLAYTHIQSPIDGYVGEKSAEIGQTVGAGNTILTLIPSGPGKIYITANFKETQVGDMRVGQSVDIAVDAYHGHTFHGRVLSINPASQNTYALVPAQNATGNFVKVTQRIPVRISIDDTSQDMPLRPGMSVEASVKVR